MDPDGRYGRDVHINLSVYLAEKAGFSPKEANEIALANQGTDESSTTGPFVSKAARSDYHFASPERRQEMRQIAFESGDLQAFGQYLHTLMDSYSHQKGRTESL